MVYQSCLRYIAVYLIDVTLPVYYEPLSNYSSILSNWVSSKTWGSCVFQKKKNFRNIKECKSRIHFKFPDIKSGALRGSGTNNHWFRRNITNVASKIQNKNGTNRRRASEKESTVDCNRAKMWSRSHKKDISDVCVAEKNHALIPHQYRDKAIIQLALSNKFVQF